jgi:hypothetical protein
MTCVALPLAHKFSIFAAFDLPGSDPDLRAFEPASACACRSPRPTCCFVSTTSNDAR